MPSKAKVVAVNSLKDKLSKAKSVVFAKYTGLNSAQQTKLRHEVKAAGGEIVITKNRLLNVALGKPAGLDEMLQDQLLTLFSYQDEVSALKAVTKFAETNDLPELKGGFLEGQVLSAQQVKTLSLTPGRLELVAMLLRTLQAPAQNLRNVVEAVPGSLVRVLNSIAVKQ